MSDASNWISSIQTAAESYADERSGRWSASDSGYAYREWIYAMDDISRSALADFPVVSDLLDAFPDAPEV